MMNAEDWRALRLPLIGLALALGAGGAPVYFTSKSVDRARVIYQSQQAALDQATQQFQKSDEEIRTINRYLADFRALQSEGFIGSGQRINWIEAVRESNQRLRLFGMQWHFSEQQPYSAPGAADTQGLKLQQSEMKLNLSLLHEEDLLRLFEDLKAQKVGIYTVKSCSLQRLDQGSRPTYQPHVLAECNLAWVTLNFDQPKTE